MNNINFYAEGTGYARSHYGLEQAKQDWCAYTIKTLEACKSVAEAVDHFRRQKQYHINEIKEYDTGVALNKVLITITGIKRVVQEIEARVRQVPQLLKEYQEEKDRCENQQKFECKQGLSHCRQHWKILTGMMGHAHSFPSLFFFQGNARIFCERMYGCEGMVFRHIDEQLTGHRHKRHKNAHRFSSNTNADIIMLNIFQFVCDCSMYIPRKALQDDGEHLVQCSCCYTARMGEQILKTGNSKMRQLWFKMTTTPWEPRDNIRCNKYDRDYPNCPAYSPTSPRYSPTQSSNSFVRKEE